MSLNITNCKFSFPHYQESDGFLGYADITIDGDLVVRGIRLIQRPDGSRFCWMPSVDRRTTCTNCRRPRVVRNHYCGQCGFYHGHAVITDENGYDNSSKQVAFPCNHKARITIEAAVEGAFKAALDSLKNETKGSSNVDRVQ
jgi:DNA-binding cell septation regulator SpoVG